MDRSKEPTVQPPECPYCSSLRTHWIKSRAPLTTRLEYGGKYVCFDCISHHWCDIPTWIRTTARKEAGLTA